MTSSRKDVWRRVADDDFVCDLVVVVVVVVGAGAASASGLRSLDPQ